MELSIYLLNMKLDDIVHAKDLEHLTRIGKSIAGEPLTADTLAVLRAAYEKRKQHLVDFGGPQ